MTINFHTISPQEKKCFLLLEIRLFENREDWHEISLKPGAPRHLIFISKVNFLFSMKLWEERLVHPHHDSSLREKFKSGLGECQVISVWSRL
jgi:hypothetical protein